MEGGAHRPAGRICGGVKGKVDFMRPCYRQRLYLMLGALASGILAFALLAAGVLVLVPASTAARLFFTTAAAFSLLGGLVLTWSVLHRTRPPALAYAWFCWGRTAGTGTLGGVLTALGASLVASSQVLVHLGAAAWVFFLVLELGGLLGLVGKYAAVRFRCCCRGTCG